MLEVYDELVEPKVLEPTIVIDHPRRGVTAGQAAPRRPDLVERFELIVDGRELANAYSELNDPVEQRRASRTRAPPRRPATPRPATSTSTTSAPSSTACHPTGGMGMGIDRLVMLLAGVETIREVILFPTLRPEVF